MLDNLEETPQGEMPTATPVEPLVLDENEADIAVIVESNDIDALRKLLSEREMHIKKVNAEAAERRIAKRDSDKRLAELQAQMSIRESEMIAQQENLKQEMELRLAAESQSLAQARAEAEESKKLASNAKIETLKSKIGIKYKLPEVLSERLSGTTQEELEADAVKIAESLPQRSISNDAGNNNLPLNDASLAIKKRMEDVKHSYRM